MTELKMKIPGTPPSVNHYKMRARDGHWYVTGAAKDFKDDVARCSRGKQIRAKEYALEVTIYLGTGQRLDGDNGWKVLADALVQCGVIHSDAAVKDWILHIRRDRAYPRTEVTIWDASEVTFLMHSRVATDRSDQTMGICQPSQPGAVR